MRVMICLGQGGLRSLSASSLYFVFSFFLGGEGKEGGGGGGARGGDRQCNLQPLIQPWICAPGTHYGWVDRGTVEYEVCQYFYTWPAVGIEPQTI